MQTNVQRWRRTLPALLFVLYSYLLIMLLCFAPRYRLAVEPFLILLAAAFGGGLVELASGAWRRWREAR